MPDETIPWVAIPRPPAGSLTAPHLSSPDIRIEFVTHYFAYRFKLPSIRLQFKVHTAVNLKLKPNMILADRVNKRRDLPCSSNALNEHLREQCLLMSRALPPVRLLLCDHDVRSAMCTSLITSHALATLSSTTRTVCLDPLRCCVCKASALHGGGPPVLNSEGASLHASAHLCTFMASYTMSL